MALPSTHEIERDESHSATTIAHLAAQEWNLRSKDDQSAFADAVLGSRVMSQVAWRHYKRLGVVRYPLNRAARIAGATRIFAAVTEDEDKPPTRLEPGDTNDEAIDVVRGIYARWGGLRGLIERYFLLQKIPADSHLIRIKVRGGYDGYWFVSPQEIRGPEGQEFDPAGDTLGELRFQTSPGYSGRVARSRPLARQDVLGRVWAPSPEYLEVPDSPLYTLDADCDLLWMLQTVLRAQVRSRAITGNMHFYPDTLNRLASGQHVAHTSAELIDVLNKIYAENITFTEQAEAAEVSPILVAGQPEAGAQIREIIFGGDTKETDLQLRNELFDRIMFSLDINTRATTGESQNHFAAWSDSSDELRLAVIPDVEAMCWSFTRLILRPALAKLNWSPERINSTVVWYDISQAAVRINRNEDARQLIDRMGLNLKTGRQVAGFTEDQAPTEDEYVRQFGVMTKNPFMGLWGLDVTNNPDWDWGKAMPKGTAGKPQDSPADDPESEPGEGDPGSPDDTDAPLPNE